MGVFEKLNDHLKDQIGVFKRLNNDSKDQIDHLIN